MRIEYDPEANALYIRFRDTKPADNIDIEDGLTVDLDDQKRLIGIEILDVSHRLPPRHPRNDHRPEPADR